MKIKSLFCNSVLITLFLLFTVSIETYSINYTISFTGSGASSTVESVVVQNLTKGTKVTVSSGNTLNLSDTPNAIEQITANDESICVYQNTTEGKSTMSFYVKQEGKTQINAYSIDGRKVITTSMNLIVGKNSFELYLPKGSYVLQVVGTGYSYKTKIISQTKTTCQPKIIYTANENNNPNTRQKSKSSVISMLYSPNDQLLYKGNSGNFSSLVADVPTGNKTVNFDFIDCKDGDGQYYTTVTIGSQIWMVENLKATKYNDGSTILNITTDDAWNNSSTGAYCNYNNDARYVSSYGRLYNWYAANDLKLAPNGWHVASDDDWRILQNYLIANGYNYDLSTTDNNIAKSLASNSFWQNYLDTNIPGFEAVPGYNQQSNNKSGFSANPNGSFDWGSFRWAGVESCWWTRSSSHVSSYLNYDNSSLTRGINTSWSHYGYAVRCVKDKSAEIVIDKDGHIYNTIKIGTQTWMAEDLKTSWYNDGTYINIVSSQDSWNKLTTGALCYYTNTSTSSFDYGSVALYNWYAVSSGKLAPKGWHIPSETEWNTLENYLITNAYNFDETTTGNKIAKSLAANIGWNNSTVYGAIGNDLSKNYKSQFNATANGCRDYSVNWTINNFKELGYSCYWWTSSSAGSSTAYARALYYSGSNLYHLSGAKSYSGFSVRCIKD